MTSPFDQQKNKIRLDLQAAATHYENAHKAAATGIEKASEIARRAAPDYPTIALRMRKIADMLQHLNGALKTTINHVSATTDLATTGPAGENPEAVINRLSPAIEQMETTRTRTQGIAQQLAKIETEIRGTLQGGQPGPMLAITQRIRSAIVPASQNVTSAKQKAEESIQKARQTGN